MKVGPPFSGWVGPRLSGLVFGPSFSRWGCWRILHGVGVDLSFFGPVFLVWVLALPSNCPFLEMVGWPLFLGVGFFSSAVVGPSFLPIFLAVSGPHSFLEWRSALRDESWPCCLGGGNWLPSQPFLPVVRGFALPSGSGAKPRKAPEKP